jgi:transcriptional regulator of acetoin/glycerol metabolism
MTIEQQVRNRAAQSLQDAGMDYLIKAGFKCERPGYENWPSCHCNGELHWHNPQSLGLPYTKEDRRDMLDMAVREKWIEKGVSTISELAKLCDVSRGTIYKRLKTERASPKQ